MSLPELPCADAQERSPDGWSFIAERELGADGYAVIRARLDDWRPEMTHYRLTDMTGEFARDGWPVGVWIEVWRERPLEEAPFAPPLTAHPPGQPASPSEAVAAQVDRDSSRAEK